MSDLPPDPGSTLKALRAARAWSLSQTAAQTGVSKAMLGQIERGESSPTVATLWKIATGFNVPFSLFITSRLPDAPCKATPGAPQPVWQQHSAAMRAASMFPFDDELRVDMLIVELAAGQCSVSSAHERGVIEHVIVIEGQLMLKVSDQWHTLEAEQGLRFQADQPHTYRNDGSQTARFYSLIHYGAQKIWPDDATSR
ncbi:helix-turn-helix domain-containing protein [Erwinia oleae]|uniref:helix-turn-helix domain-containing protein n=1 Tax=Erwinia oleae TaxID=796334 RepID=UPI000558DC74|nr:XRE family transcriptional regulator [Erwinia oleae]